MSEPHTHREVLAKAEWTVAYYQDELDKLWPESPREGT